VTGREYSAWSQLGVLLWAHPTSAFCFQFSSFFTIERSFFDGCPAAIEGTFLPRTIGDLANAGSQPRTAAGRDSTARSRVPSPRSMRRPSSARGLRLCGQSLTLPANAYICSSFRPRRRPAPAMIVLPPLIAIPSLSCHPCRRRLCPALKSSQTPWA